MAFTKLNSFSKKPSDMPDIPSPSMTPDDIRSLWETPLDELLGAQSDLVDQLNGTSWVGNDKLAPKAVGVANLADDILNQPTTPIEVQMKLADHDVQLAEKTQVDYKFIDLIESGQITGIKLIGDSVDVGVGAGGVEDTTRSEIGTTGHYEADITTPVWANFFRNYIAEKYPAITFFNAGIGGWSAKVEGAQYGTDWYGTNNDTCFVMLGTNDRSDCVDEVDFENAIETFLKGVEANCNHLFVMTAPPTNNDFDASGVKISTLNLTMEQIDKVISRVCVKNGWKHISFYRKFLEYQLNTEISFDDLLQTDGGSHPIESGYMLMWKIFQQELGLIVNTYDWRNTVVDTKKMNSISESGSLINSTTPITGYRANCVTYHAIATTHTDVANFPTGLGGTLKTVRPYSDSFAYQEFIVYGKGWSFKRYANGSAWRSWIFESILYGSTGARPVSGQVIGMMYFDQTLAKPIWWSGSGWRDATGTVV